MDVSCALKAIVELTRTKFIGITKRRIFISRSRGLIITNTGNEIGSNMTVWQTAFVEQMGEMIVHNPISNAGFTITGERFRVEGLGDLWGTTNLPTTSVSGVVTAPGRIHN